MKTQTAKHWDAWGNPTKSYEEMKHFFRGDKKSMEVLSRFMPCQYVYLPDIEITFNKKDPCVITVFYIRFCSRTVRTFVLKPENLAGFRKIWTKKKKGWVCLVSGDNITMRHDGGLHPIRYRKFGV